MSAVNSKSLLIFFLSTLVSFVSISANSSSEEQEGKKVFDKWCGICHGKRERMPGTASLAIKYDGNPPAALEERTDMSAEFIRYNVRNGVMIMPAFRATEISNAELDLLVDYLKAKK